MRIQPTEDRYVGAMDSLASEAGTRGQAERHSHSREAQAGRL
jgi:hypothetical protein